MVQMLSVGSPRLCTALVHTAAWTQNDTGLVFQGVAPAPFLRHTSVAVAWAVTTVTRQRSSWIFGSDLGKDSCYPDVPAHCPWVSRVPGTVGPPWEVPWKLLWVLDAFKVLEPHLGNSCPRVFPSSGDFPGPLVLPLASARLYPVIQGSLPVGAWFLGLSVTPAAWGHGSLQGPVS